MFLFRILLIFIVLVITPTCIAAEDEHLYDMVRVDKVDPKTNFFEGPIYDGALLWPAVKTRSDKGKPFNGYSIVSDKGVVHTFDSKGNEISTKRIKLDGVTMVGLSSVATGAFAGSAFITTETGNTYVVRDGKILVHIPNGLPPAGLSGASYTRASQFSDDLMVLGDNKNRLIFINLRTKKIQGLFLSHIDAGMVLAPPLVVRNSVFSTSTDGHLYRVVFDAQSMAVTSTAEHDFGEPIEAPPVLLSNGDLVVATGSGRIVFMSQDFGPGKIQDKSLGAPSERRGLRLFEDNLLAVGTKGGKSILAIVNTSTKETGKTTTTGPLSRDCLFIRCNGKEIFVIVDGWGNGYVTDVRLQKLGTFKVGEDPYSGPILLGGKIRVSTASARLASLEFKNFKNARIESVAPSAEF